MKTAAKILLALVLVLVAGAAAGYWWLNRDPAPPAADVAGLSSVASSEIPAAPDSQEPAPEGLNIRVDGFHFKDRAGRSLVLRGVNLGGSSKVPFSPYMPSHVREGFFDAKNVSFVGRPFPLEQADEHFARLKRWGLHFARLVITWEAVEHEGPGVYDRQYLDYLRAVVEKAGDHGIDVFIDPHQDVWSRFSGGDGAPLWTLEAAGLDPAQFAEAGAAIVHATHGDPFPRMVWFSNYSKLASATMFTLFFGGDRFAPGLTVEGIPIQRYLQEHFVNAMREVALRLRGLPNVAGFQFLNEPSAGFIGLPDISRPASQIGTGESPTPLQAMALGCGIPQTVRFVEVTDAGFAEGEPRLVNPNRVSSWADPEECLWRKMGVWSLDESGQPRPDRPDYFLRPDGDREIDFSEDFMRPAIEAHRDAIAAVDPEWAIFVEPTVFPVEFELPRFAGQTETRFVNEPHFYDGVTLITKQFIPWIGFDMEHGGMIYGRRAVRESIENRLAHLKAAGEERLGPVPTLIGETGAPFDLDNGASFETGDFSQQAAALDRVLRALEKNRLSYTLWNYTADNSNARGDQWNGEDLSIFSPDQRVDPTHPDSGGRALDAVVRPYPRRVAGEILEFGFDRARREFLLRFQPDPKIAAPTEIFVPKWHYGDGYEVFSRGGGFAWNPSDDALLFRPDDPEVEQILVIRPAGR